MKALVLDFGNVIAFFDHRRACRRLAALSTARLSEEDVYRRVFESPLEPEVDRGRIGPPEFLNLLREHLELDAPDEAIVRAWCDIFQPNDHLIGQLPRLGRMAGRLVLASNTNALHFQWIAREFAGPLAGFHALVLSHEVGLRKPDAAFFSRCASEAGVPSAECVFVDDVPAFVEAARACGMRGIVYERGLDLVRLLEAAGHGGRA